MVDALKSYVARCHCERVKVQFSICIDKVWTCNCTYCRVRGGHWIYVSQQDVKFIQGRELLKSYRFKTYSSDNMFCRTCGIHLVCVPRVLPKHYAVRVECIYDVKIGDFYDRIQLFDGLNWEENAAALRKIETDGTSLSAGFAYE